MTEKKKPSDKQSVEEMLAEEALSNTLEKVAAEEKHAEELLSGISAEEVTEEEKPLLGIPAEEVMEEELLSSMSAEKTPAEEELSSIPAEELPTEEPLPTILSEETEVTATTETIVTTTETVTSLADLADIEPETAANRIIEIEPWESLGLANDFIFGKVMQKSELCRTLLQFIFPELKIEKIEYLETQKSIENDREAHGVRLDVYVKDSKGRIFNLEMQKKTKPELPKRSRYYQSMVDLQNLNKGQSYQTLKKSFVIFICLEDMFGEKRHIYTFEHTCRENRELQLKDGAIKVFLNASGELDDISQDLKAFLDYLRGIPSEHPFVKALDQAVREAKMNREWRREYMIRALRDQDMLWEGMERGRIEGKKEGIKEGKEEGIKEGKKEGIKEGIKEGKKEGIKEGLFLSIKNLMESMGWSAEQAMEGLKIPESEREKYLKELRKLKENPM